MPETAPDFSLDQPVLPEQTGDVSPDVLAARRVAGTVRRPPVKPVEIASDEDYDKLAPGTRFVDPQRNVRVKPYAVRSDDDFDLVPEGAQFLDPKGELRTKPKFENVDFTTQALYDMAITDKERRKILARQYGEENIKTDPKTGQPFAEVEGKYYRPKGGAGTLAAAAAPVGGAILGAIGGAAGGTAVGPGPGTFVGGVVGAGTGGAGGQIFNDMVLQLAGVYDRTPTEEAVNLALSSGMSMAGAGVGRGLAAVAPALRGAITTAGPGAAAHFLGARAPETTMARQLSEKGVLVPPSAHLFEAPHLHNIVEVFDPAFHTQQPLLESATQYYEKTGRQILESSEIGVKRAEPLAEPKAAVSPEEAGVTLIRRAREEAQVADDRLNAEIENRRAQLQAGAQVSAAAHEASIKSLRAAEEESRKAAQRMIDAGFQDIQTDIDHAMKVAEAGHNSGDLWWSVGEKLRAVRQGIGARATKMYAEADRLSGGHLPDISGLPERAEDLLSQLPEGFENKYPAVVKQLRDLAGVKDDKGEWIKEPVSPTFGQLHNLRSLMRQQVNWLDLTPDVREGVHKFFARRIDEILHGVNEPVSFVSLPKNIKIRVEDRLPVRPGADRIINVDFVDQNNKVQYTAKLRPTGLRKDHYIQWVENIGRDYKKLGPAVYDALAREMERRGGKLYGRFDGPESLTTVAESVHDELTRLGAIEKTGGLGPRIIKPIRISARQEALRDAARALDQADTFYRDNMRPLTDRNIQAVLNGLESGLPADPKMLYNTLVKEGRSDLTRKAVELVGPNLWAGVKAADVQEMLDASRSLIPGQIDGRKFAMEVLARHRADMLEAVHGREASEKLLRQAQNIAMLDGKLPIDARPYDTMTDVISRARTAAEAAKEAAKIDPLGSLNKEMKKMQVEQARELARLRSQRNRSALGFLYNPNVGAAEAVDKILGSEDLIIATAAKFGEKSPEFNLLRQVYAQRVLENTLRPGARLAKMSPEIQQLIFPGSTLEQMQTLAKEMDFLLETRAGTRGTAQGMAAMAKVEHPWGTIGTRKSIAGTVIKGLFGSIPGSDPAARAALGKYYELWRKLFTSPVTLRFIEKGLKGNPEEREVVRAMVQRAMKRGGAVGAGAAQATYETPRELSEQ